MTVSLITERLEKAKAKAFRIIESETANTKPVNRISGVPSGWHVVRLDIPKIGEWYWYPRIDKPVQNKQEAKHKQFILEKCGPVIRPFRSASEFEPYRDEWVYCTSGGDISRVDVITNDGVHIAGRANVIPWDVLFKGYKFKNGYPCGLAE